jgi:hypothetical protein
MHFGLIVLSLVGEIAMLARAAFGIMILCLAIPVLRAMWSSLRTRPRSGDSPDLDALWKRYKRGEISWDEYLRCEVEGVRRAGLDRGGPSSNSASDDVPF